MADNNGGEGLSESQTEMVLQFQDFTGIDDMVRTLRLTSIVVS